MTAIIRTIGYILVLVVLVGAAVWLADNPGEVSLEWWGWRLETSFAVLALGLAVFAVGVAAVYRLWLALWRVPGRMVGSRRENRRRRGYLALTRGMVAVAAGDAAEAQRQVRRADGLLEEPPLTLLLQAQASQLAGDERAAEKFFGAMLDKPETEFLGLRGLLTQALKGKDHKKAQELAERAFHLRPKSDWVASNLVDLQVKNRAWAEARATLEKSVKNRVVTAEEAHHRGVALDYRLSLDASASGDTSKAMKLLRAAHEREPGFIPAAARLAETLIDGGRQGRAATVIERAWSHAPHPDLAEAYWQAKGANDALERVKAAQRLAKSNPGHLESQLTLAETALEARLWGEARRHLKAAAGDAPSARVCRLMAELEDSEHGDAEAAHAWLVRASMADPDPAWVCGDCGNSVAEWTIVCGNCDGFAGFTWRRPPHVIRLAGRSEAEPRAITSQAPADGVVATGGTESTSGPEGPSER